jgi:hypothetical protein
VESLEHKLDRLSLEQRREVEDFVDFLLSRNAPVTTALPASAPAPSVPPVLVDTPPVLPVHDLQPAHETVTVSPPPTEDSPEPPEPVISEIAVGGDDWITRDYMDYGKFEPEPSPATEAVKKVRRKIIQKGQEEKPRQILDWID